MKHNHKPGLLFLLLLCGLLLAAPRPGQAQEDTPQLTVRLGRDFGYSSGGGDIQGTFSFRASGPDNLESVTFYIDDEAIGTVTQPPFRLQFNTDNYGLGLHTLRATGVTSDGQILESTPFVRNFVTAGEGWQAAGRIVVPLLGGMVLIMAVAWGITMLASRRRGTLPLGAPRQYGAYGGAICPKCQRPYSMHMLAMNLLTKRYDYCPHCGKWSLVKRATPEELAAAEKAELALASPDAQVPELSPEEKLRRQLEDSRFEDTR